MKRKQTNSAEIEISGNWHFEMFSKNCQPKQCKKKLKKKQKLMLRLRLKPAYLKLKTIQQKTNKGESKQF